MALNLEQKTTIITDYKLHEKDTGSSEVQIAFQRPSFPARTPQASQQTTKAFGPLEKRRC